MIENVQRKEKSSFDYIDKEKSFKFWEEGMFPEGITLKEIMHDAQRDEF